MVISDKNDSWRQPRQARPFLLDCLTQGGSAASSTLSGGKTMPSFDVVSKVDLQEVDNAVNQACKEIDQRYDFKGTHNEITLEKDAIVILAADDYKLTAVIDVLKGKLVRRGVSPKCLDFGKKEPASHGAMRQRVAIVQGIDKERGKEIIKSIKESKLKVQAQIMEEQVRVSGKQIDDLQEVIQLLKGQDFGIELQFVNMRS
jgi:cyclic-di-GMP-binding protein